MKNMLVKTGAVIRSVVIQFLIVSMLVFVAHDSQARGNGNNNFIQSTMNTAFETTQMANAISQLSPTCSGPGQSPLQCMTCNCYFEARGEPDDGKTMVGRTVVARFQSRNSQWHTSSICSVIYQPWQFSWTRPINRSARSRNPATLRMTDRNSVARCGSLMYTVLNTPNRGPFPTMFHACAGRNRVTPDWLGPQNTRIGQIGNHCFYVNRNAELSRIRSGNRTISSIAQELPPEVKRAIVTWNPKFSTFTKSDFTKEVNNLFEEKGRTPYSLNGDFNGDKIQDYALLGSAGKEQLAVAVLSGPKGFYKAEVIESWDLAEIRNPSSDKSGNSTSAVYLAKAGEGAAETYSKKHNRDVVQIEAYQGAVELYAFENGKFKSILPAKD